jgi:PhnB protein
MPPTPPKGIIPHLTCKGAAAAIDFYKKAFGAEEVARHPYEDGRVMHAELRIGDALFFLNDDFPEFCGGKSSVPQAGQPRSCVLHQNVANCDAAMKRFADAGGTITMPAADMFWGDRYGQATDPFGHTWSFATPLPSKK